MCISIYIYIYTYRDSPEFIYHIRKHIYESFFFLLSEVYEKVYIYIYMYIYIYRFFILWSYVEGIEDMR